MKKAWLAISIILCSSPLYCSLPASSHISNNNHIDGNCIGFIGVAAPLEDNGRVVFWLICGICVFNRAIMYIEGETRVVRNILSFMYGVGDDTGYIIWEKNFKFHFYFEWGYLISIGLLGVWEYNNME